MVEPEAVGIDILGALFAVGTGALYGCQGLFLSNAHSGAPIPNGASMMLTQFPLMIAFAVLRWLLVRGEDPRGDLTMRAILLALLGGILFGIGFIGQVYVLGRFGDAIGTPLTQANLVVAGIWSVAVFKEVQGRDLIGAFVVSSLGVLLGVSLLAVF